MALVKQILCLYLPHWPIMRRLRQHPERRGQVLLVVRAVSQRRIVVDASVAARRSGVRTGMTVAEARALLGKVVCIDDDPTADRRALAALGRWLTRFTPIVSCEWDESCVDPPAALWLDLTGCERLSHGIDRVADLMQQSLQRFGIPAGIAVAPTVGGAWALARTARSAVRIVDSKTLPNFASGLPVSTLRLTNEILADLLELGLLTVGDVIALPRDTLPSRFGALLGKRLDQLFGTIAEPLVKLVYDPPVCAHEKFESSIESPQTIELIFQHLLQQVLADLTRRGHGVRLLRMTLVPDRGWGRSIVKREIALSRPHRHSKTLAELISREIERIDCEHGFVVLRLEVPIHEAVTESQSTFFDRECVADELEFDLLLQRLRARLGDDAVIRPHRVESYLPERAWRPAGDNESPSSRATITSPRPLTLFTKPVEIRVVCEPSDDRTGQPRQFTCERDTHRLTQVIGPERIAGEWWRGHRRTRDYYEVESETGCRFWIFRVLSQRMPEQVIARWFLHGRFD